MSNRIEETIKKKGGGILNVYFTAGYPQLEDTGKIIGALQENGVDLVELGMPYSDPLADGVTIQKSSAQALKNGITLDIIFDQVKEARKNYNVPILMMGYYNQLLQYGVEKFIEKAADIGIDGMIIPDMPMNIYERDYLSLFKKYNMGMTFLIGPHTSDERIKQADRLSEGFLYVISQTSITGKSGDISDQQEQYFDKIKGMGLSTPQLIGFGIHDKATYQKACKYSSGAIIGSAYIRALNENPDIQESTTSFINKIR